MGGRYSSLFKESTIPGLSTIFASKPRASKLLLMNVLIILVILTLKDLYSIASDYFTYPITVSVLVTESRVLPFPAVTVCNLNPIHRGRFCSAADIFKPESIDKIVCTDLTDLFQVCKITESLRDLVEDGRAICEGTGSSGSRGRRRPRTRKVTTRRRPSTEASNTTSNARNRKSSLASGRIESRTRARRTNNRQLTTVSTNLDGEEKNVSIDSPLSIEGSSFNSVDQLSNKDSSALDTSIRRESDPPTGRRTDGRSLRHKKMTVESKERTFVPVESDSTLKVTKRESGFDDSTNLEGRAQSNHDDEEEEEQKVNVESADEDETLHEDNQRQMQVKLPLHSSCPLTRTKRAEPQFNLRTLFATFKSVQKGNFTGGLLEPFMVS